jgi:hypothetical protein
MNPMNSNDEKKESQDYTDGWTMRTLYIHFSELRKADERAITLAQTNNQQHFEQLNENAKRTIEERGHFVSNEAFEPFRDSVTKQIAAQTGSTTGTDKTVSYVISGIGILFGIAGIAIALLS